jgi:hypothetical protein
MDDYIDIDIDKDREEENKSVRFQETLKLEGEPVKPPKPKKSRAELCKLVWAECKWRRVGANAALKAIDRTLSVLASKFRGQDDASAAAAEWLAVRCRKYTQAVEGQDVKFLPHPATWFNAGRYDDDDAEWTVSEHSGVKQIDPNINLEEPPF